MPGVFAWSISGIKKLFAGHVLGQIKSQFDALLRVEDDIAFGAADLLGADVSPWLRLDFAICVSFRAVPQLSISLLSDKTIVNCHLSVERHHDLNSSY